MIKRFADKLTQRLFHREGQHKKLDQALQRSALRKVIMIDNAIDINDLRVPPGNKLKVLSEDRKGQHSIRINDKWRICFVWTGADADEVEIVDYH